MFNSSYWVTTKWNWVVKTLIDIRVQKQNVKNSYEGPISILTEVWQIENGEMGLLVSSSSPSSPLTQITYNQLHIRA